MPFFYDILAVLWDTRERNKHYLLFRKFPWDSQPQPDFFHIEVIDTEEMNPEQKAFLQHLESQVISAPTYTAKVTPDYLLGFDGETKYFIMPLGHIFAEASRINPEDDSRYLIVKGRDREGKPMKVELPDWVIPADKEYDEGEFFLRFINRWMQ